MQRVRTFPSSIQRHQLYGKASVTLSPSDLAGAHVGPDALPVGAGDAVEVADGHGAGVAQVPQVLVLHLGPPVQADHVRLVVADVAVGLLVRLKKLTFGWLGLRRLELEMS